MSANAMDRLWRDYQDHHQTTGNRTCHMVGIPLIIIGLLGLLAIPIAHLGRWPIEVSLLIVTLVGAIDIWLDPRLGLLMLVTAFVIYLAARLVAWQVLSALFVIGWGFQFVGHGVYERRSPAFYKNLAHLIVGPLWALNHFTHLRNEAGDATASEGS